MINCYKVKSISSRGGSRIFSRWGGFSKKIENFVNLFLRPTTVIFELSQGTKMTLFWPNFLLPRQIFEKTGNFNQKIAFFVARFTSKLVYIGAKDAFRKILGSVSQKWISQNSTKGDPLGRHGVESLRGLPFLTPPLVSNILFVHRLPLSVLK